MIQIHAFVSGFVQGVNFRYYTMQHAKSLKLKGMVRNLIDGKVEVIAQGKRANLEMFLDWLHHGPISASVSNVQVEWEKSKKKYKRFAIKY